MVVFVVIRCELLIFYLAHYAFTKDGLDGYLKTFMKNPLKIKRDLTILRFFFFSVANTLKGFYFPRDY